MTDDRALTCATCGEVLERDASAGATTSAAPCPICGSTEQIVRLTFDEDVTAKVRDQLKGKLTDDSLPSRKKVRREFIVGSDRRVSKGDYVYKERDIDRDRDIYREYVAEEDGTVLRDVQEKLTDHWGHGSAKAKPGRDPDDGA